jgi:hypothetical protein
MNEANKSAASVQSINDAAMAGIRTHRLKLRALNVGASVLGVAAVLTSIVIVWSYLILYLPKDKEIMRGAEMVLMQAKTLPVEEVAKQQTQFLQAEIVFTHVIAMCVTLIAVAVGILGLGTLLLLGVIVMNRRATLSQIQASLAQISEQLRLLKEPR